MRTARRGEGLGVTSSYCSSGGSASDGSDGKAHQAGEPLLGLRRRDRDWTAPAQFGDPRERPVVCEPRAPPSAEHEPGRQHQLKRVDSAICSSPRRSEADTV